jgi:hypothetical protein
MQEVYAAIASLPEDFRLALVSVDVLGLSYREAAHALRVREATVTTRLFRARKAVARRLLPESPDDASELKRAMEDRSSSVLSSGSDLSGGSDRSSGVDRPGGRDGPGTPDRTGGLDRAELNRTVGGADGEDKAPRGVLPSRRTT